MDRFEKYPGLNEISNTCYGMHMTTLDVLFHYSELLSGHERDAMEDTLAGYHDELPFCYEDCRILITGLPTGVYHKFGWLQPDAFAFFVLEYMPQVNALLRGNGYKGISLIYLFDGQKRLVTIFSPATDQPNDPVPMAEELTAYLQTRYEAILLQGTTEHCNFSVLSEPIHAFEEIAPAFTRLRELVNFSFFRREPIVLTEKRLQQWRIPMDEVAAAEEYRQLRGCISGGEGQGAVEVLRKLFLARLKYSFDFRRVEDTLAYCRNILRTSCLTYGADLPKDLDLLCDYNHYPDIEHCHAAVAAAVEALCQRIGRAGRGYSYITKEAIYYIRTHYDKDQSLSSIAAYVNVVPTYLSSVFKRETKQTVNGYLAAVRLEKACALLTTGNLRISEVAAAVGITNSRYFSIFFKKATGMSPADYRAAKRA